MRARHGLSLALAFFAASANAAGAGHWIVHHDREASGYKLYSRGNPRSFLMIFDQSNVDDRVNFFVSIAGWRPRPGSEVVFKAGNITVSLPVGEKGLLLTHTDATANAFNQLWAMFRRGGHLQMASEGHSATIDLGDAAKALPKTSPDEGYFH